MTAVILVLIATGVAFSLIAAVGLIRLPDLLMRMHAATKAGTLGAGLLLIAAAVGIGDIGVVLRAAAAIVFLLLTAPVAAHLIARAAYRTGQVRLWRGTLSDELAEATPSRAPGREARQDLARPPKTSNTRAMAVRVNSTSNPS
jgi:multicomponent Na+:H+ antiporter subunit G